MVEFTDHRNDAEFYTHVVEEVKDLSDLNDGPAFELKIDRGSMLWVKNPNKLPPPEVGDQVHFYGRGFGYPVRGVICGENVYYYRTEAEADELHRQEVEKMRQEKREDFQKNKAQWDKDLAALPPEFQARIQRFQSRNKDWEWNFGPYEMFCCKEAHKILKAIGSVENQDVIVNLRDFSDAEYDEQKKMIPTLDYENHSGNTFGASVMLAGIYLRDKSFLPKAHGALCPLVGCQDYGCYAAEVAEEE
jgi:hypothetical protein